MSRIQDNHFNKWLNKKHKYIVSSEDIICIVVALGFALLIISANSLAEIISSFFK